VNKFEAPKRSLGDLDAEVAAKLIAAASDIALIVGDDGVIQDVSFSSDELSQQGDGLDWRGRPWVDTVTVESRPKVEALLKSATGGEPIKWREINHASPQGQSLPVRYSTIRLGDQGRLVAIGRDLRALSTLQQRLVDTQISMEREYARLRNAETRYRLLFQLSSEAVLIADAATLRVVEANPAAERMIAPRNKRVVGMALLDLFDDKGSRDMQALLSAARSSARPDDAHVMAADSDLKFTASVSLFRQESTSFVLVRLVPDGSGRVDGESAPVKSRVIRIVESMPDAFVLTDAERRILDVNPAFLDLAQLATPEQARGEPLDRWLGRTGVDVNVLYANLREHGTVRGFATMLRGEFGTSEEVEVSAVSALGTDMPSLGFILRPATRRAPAETRLARDLPRSVEQLADLVGRMSLKDLVRETTDVIERLCIEAALELTGDNRASAAQMLGLSRQSLYSKLRRYGLGNLGPDDEE
jgi:transcriptional regulator PpsR